MNILLKHLHSYKPIKYVESITSMGCSHYFTYGANLVIRVSNHTGSSSDGMYHIIYDSINRKNYVLHNPKENVLTCMTFAEIKNFINMLHILTKLHKDTQHLTISRTSSKINSLEGHIKSLKAKLVEAKQNKMNIKVNLDKRIEEAKNKQPRYILGGVKKANSVKNWLKKRGIQLNDYAFDDPKLAYVFNYSDKVITTTSDLELIKRIAIHEKI